MLWHRRDLWAEAVSTAAYIVNRSPHSRLQNSVWSGTTVYYSFLKVFGCTAYAHINDVKLAPRAVKCIFIGYSSESKSYRLWNLESKKVLLSRDVTFNENAMRNEFGLFLLLAQVISRVLVRRRSWRLVANLLWLMVTLPQAHNLAMMRLMITMTVI